MHLRNAILAYFYGGATIMMIDEERSYGDIRNGKDELLTSTAMINVEMGRRGEKISSHSLPDQTHTILVCT